MEKYPARCEIGLILDNKTKEQVSRFCYLRWDKTYNLDHPKLVQFQSKCGIRQALPRKLRTETRLKFYKVTLCRVAVRF